MDITRGLALSNEVYARANVAGFSDHSVKKALVRI
jgi:hypothetical protein